MPARRPRLHRQLHLGHDREGVALSLDPFALVEGNLGVIGASGSGKSWLAGLLVEELIKEGYQVCVIDPEGDYRAFRTFERTLLLGSAESHLPAVNDVAALVDYTQMSLVLDLSVYTLEERNSYVQALLRTLAGSRAKHGRPHWFLIDEIQSFSPPEGGELTDLLLQMCQDGGIGLISFRPSQMSPALLEVMDH
jgi:hypothetical protein